MICSRCGQDKPLEAFHKLLKDGCPVGAAATPNNIQGYCKECKRRYTEAHMRVKNSRDRLVQQLITRQRLLDQTPPEEAPTLPALPSYPDDVEGWS